MQDNAYLKCINPKCGLEYPISSTNVQCEKGHVLDVKYQKEVFLMKVEFGDFVNY